MPHIAQLIHDTVDIDAAATDVAEHLLGCEEYMMQCRYTWHIGADEEVDFKDPEVARDFDVFVSDYAFEQACNARDELAYGLHTNEDGSITLWRSIVVPEDWLENGIKERPIGIYWAHEKAAAEPHWGSFGEGDREIVIEARVAIEDVDWQRSVCMNAQSEEEREISLKETASVFLISAEWVGPGPEIAPVPLKFSAPAGKQSTPDLDTARMAA